MRCPEPLGYHSHTPANVPRVVPVQSGVMSLDLRKPFARAPLSGLGLSLLLLASAALPTLRAQRPSPATPAKPATSTKPATPASPGQGSAAALPAPAALTPAAQRHAQQATDLINRAQASYTSGVSNFNNNRLNAARVDFDNAVDTMLAAGMDLKNDPQLSDAFEHLLDSINSLEIVALKQGNGFSPKTEETPVEEAEGEVTFVPDPALLGRLTLQVQTTKSDFPLVVNEYVAGFISFFSNSRAGQATLKRSLERAGKYQAMISKDLSDAGLPQDLIYLGVAESGFQPQRINRVSGAGGMWQFMPFQGAYGLARNGYFDERLDPEKSSLAYARYMKYLYAQFGDWYLAMAAYNWGPGNVQRAVQRTGYADFWELYRHNALPHETRNYVPLIVAAIIMAKNPQQYGLSSLVPDAPVISDTVSVEYAIDLKLVADLTDATVPEIVALNPALLRLTTPRDIAYDLHLPPGTKEVYNTRLQDIPEADRGSWRFHVVKAGETLAGIADSLHARAESIAAYNDVTAAQPLEAGDELVIPLSGSAGRSVGQQNYTPRRGDTLVTVADRFGVTVEQLREWNPTVGSSLKAGRSIHVAEPLRLAPSARRRRRADRVSVRGARGSVRAGARGKGNARGVRGARAVGRAKSTSRPAASGRRKVAAAAPRRKGRR